MNDIHFSPKTALIALKYIHRVPAYLCHSLGLGNDNDMSPATIRNQRHPAYTEPRREDLRTVSAAMLSLVR